MVNEIILSAGKILNIFPKTLWYAILIILCIVLIVMYIKYRKQMNP
ncbi:MAG: hypothetical protein WC975_02020 [Phycisphaerae bacterium]